MDGLSTEVGNKMRSAVKAKLIELGSGTAGYIDDELPDYVMIMVANKRSKEQMTTDLSLFLGKNTDVFVNWLHQVLDKLQEVSLPATSAPDPKSKRKISESTDKRDKKSKEKKRTGKDKSANSPIRSTTPPMRTAPTSITDVIADNLIQKAHQEIEPPLSVKKAERNNGTTDGFDIPTISEIASKTGKITELAELQKKIEEAKRHLNIGTGDSEDEDFINLRTDRNDLDGELDNNSHDSNSNDKSKSNRKENDPDANSRKSRNRIVYDDREESATDSGNVSIPKPSVLNRLGTRNQTDDIDAVERNDNIISLSAHRRVEQAIYVAPAQRSLSSTIARDEKSTSASSRVMRDRSRDRTARDSRSERPTRDTHRSNDSGRPVDLREKVRQRNRDLEMRRSRNQSRSNDRSGRRSSERDAPPRSRADSNQRRSPEGPVTKPTLASRIGSKVIVAKNDDHYSEEEIEVPVNSVIKVKPRPLIPKSKQACKNLLLRAVAEAQKSTALVKPVEIKPSGAAAKPELYTKAFRKNMNKDNIVVAIAANRADPVIEVDDADADGDGIDDDEYVPVPLPKSKAPLLYIPQIIKDTLHDRSLSDSKTQFVVTLDSMDYPKRKQSPQLPRRGLISASKREANRLEAKRLEPNRTRSPRNVPISVGKSESEASRPRERSSDDVPRKRRSTPITYESAAKNGEPARKQPRSSERALSRESPTKKDDHRSDSNADTSESSSKIHIGSSSQSKYDNLPPLSSAITVTTNEKPKEMKRCRFYPSCTRGDRCEYVHPSTPCKAFPNCKYGEHCLYIHPKCKFDLTCSRLDCNFTHTPVATAAPPLASHVVPVSNYKKITATTLPMLCRFYPNCSNTLCEFFHPKPCKFGKNCTNKIECNFYHFDLPTLNTLQPLKNKMKWVASAT